LLPAFVAALGLVVVAWFHARRGDTGAGTRAPAMLMVRTFVIAVPGLTLPFVIRAAVIGGVATATEVSTVYTALLGLLLRIMVGLLYMEHGLAKILDFPHQPTHAAYASFTLNPGLQGLLELLGGFLLALGLFTRTVAFILAGNMAVAYFMVHAPRGFFPLLNGGELASSIASSSFIFGSREVANGASIECARPHLHQRYRRAGPEHSAIARNSLGHLIGAGENRMMLAR
jgi:putative oxidoreductase